MKQYYYFITSLPKITYFDNRLPITKEEFVSNLEDVIFPSDITCFKALRNYFDNINFINTLNGQVEFSPYGTLSKEELEAELKDPQHLPDYLKRFLEKKNFDERLYPHYSLEDELTLYYYNYLQSLPYPFLKKYIAFDYDLKNIQAAVNARKFKIDRYKSILNLHAMSDNLIHNSAPDFGLGHHYEWLLNYLDMLERSNLHDRELKQIEMRFKFMDEELTFDPFSFNQVISYYLKLFLLDRKCKFDEHKGLEIFDQVTNNLSDEKIIFKDLDK